MTAARQRIAFGEPETIEVSALAVGDFVVSFPTQRGIRGVRLDAIVERLDDWTGRWDERVGRRGRLPVLSRRVATRLGTIDVPADCSIVVRRPAATEAAR